MKNIIFFRRNEMGQLRQLPLQATDEQIMTATSIAMKLDNQKNWWKGVCANHQANGNEYYCPVRALRRRYIHIHRHSRGKRIYLLAFWEEESVRYDVTDNDI